MVYRVLFTQKSVEDLDSIIEYYLPISEKLANDLYYLVIEKAENLQEFPERGRMVPEFLDENIRNIREILIGNYRILYRIRAKFVEVLRIIDSRQLYDMNID